MESNREIWKITYLRYSGYDCDGHVISDLYYGTFIEAARECIMMDDDSKPHTYRKVSRFTLPDTKGWKKPKYIL